MAPAADRLRTGLPMLAAVLLAHALVLGWSPWARPGWQQAAARPPLLLRRVTPAAPAALAAALEPTTTEAAAPAAAPDAPHDARPQAVAAARKPPPPLLVAVEAAAPSASSPAPSTHAGSDAVPTYATRIPASFERRYVLTRGALQGSATLAWQADVDGRYALTLRASADDTGADVIASTSTGTLDGAGVAPDRYVDRRPRRGASAVNFQRERGIVTFSGPQLTLPLAAGVQDRLSWMLQLAAIVDADPARHVPGATIAVPVVGPRGDADVWTFAIAAREDIDTPAGRVEQALRITRAPRRPYDASIEVWLDPRDGHLPAIVRYAYASGRDATELATAPRVP